MGAMPPTLDLEIWGSSTPPPSSSATEPSRPDTIERLLRTIGQTQEDSITLPPRITKRLSHIFAGNLRQAELCAQI